MAIEWIVTELESRKNIKKRASHTPLQYITGMQNFCGMDFFVNPSCIQGKKAVIEGADARHISKVLRMREGEKLIINTGGDWEYLCVIEKIQKDRVYLEIKEENKNKGRWYCRIARPAGTGKKRSCRTPF